MREEQAKPHQQGRDNASADGSHRNHNAQNGDHNSHHDDHSHSQSHSHHHNHNHNHNHSHSHSHNHNHTAEDWEVMEASRESDASGLNSSDSIVNGKVVRPASDEVARLVANSDVMLEGWIAQQPQRVQTIFKNKASVEKAVIARQLQRMEALQEHKRKLQQPSDHAQSFQEKRESFSNISSLLGQSSLYASLDDTPPIHEDNSSIREDRSDSGSEKEREKEKGEVGKKEERREQKEFRTSANASKTEHRSAELQQQRQRQVQRQEKVEGDKDKEGLNDGEHQSAEEKGTAQQGTTKADAASYPRPVMCNKATQTPESLIAGTQQAKHWPSYFQPSQVIQQQQLLLEQQLQLQQEQWKGQKQMFFHL